MSRQKIMFSLLTLLCLCALLITGCGEDKKGQRVPSDKLPEGVLEYTVLPFNDQINFAAMFVTEALQQRMVADRYNDLVCRFDMENGDPKKLEELVRKTRDAYERAEQTAEMAMDVSIALCELEKTPGYTPFKLPPEEKKSALNITAPLFSTAYAKEPYLVKTVHGPTKGSPQVIEVFSNGRARFSNEGTPPEKGWMYDQKMAEKWEAEQAKEKSEADAKAKAQAEQERAAARKKAIEAAEAKEKAMYQQAKAKNDYYEQQRYTNEEANRPINQDTHSLLQKYGHQEIVELYNSFPAGENLRGLAKALKIEGKTNYETYLKAYDVYRTAAQATDTFGTDTYAQEQAKADFEYRSSYVATAAGKCAETYISAVQSGGLVGGVDTTTKGLNAAAWTMQAYHVWKTGEEDPGLKNFQDATDKAATVTGVLSFTNKAGDPKSWSAVKEAYKAYKEKGIWEAAKSMMGLESVYNKYSDSMTAYSIASGEAAKIGQELKSAKDVPVIAASKQTNPDGTVTIRTTVTNENDPKKTEKIQAVTGQSAEEINKEVAETLQTPEDTPAEQIEDDLNPYDQEHQEFIAWLNSPEFQLVLGAAEDLRSQPYAVEKVLGTYVSTNTVFDEGITVTATYTFHFTNASDFNQKALSCMCDASASGGGQNLHEAGAYTANYDEATGTLDNPYGGDRTYFYGDGSGMYFKFSSEVPAAIKQ